MKKPVSGKLANLKYLFIILPIVMIMILSFFLLVRNKILSLSEERLSLMSEDHAEDISTWAGKVLGELNIFLDVIDAEGALDEHTFDIIAASAEMREEYPYGIYWGDEKGNYFDSSGWVPEEDYVPSQRNWYVEGLGHDAFAFGEPYLDAMTGTTCVSASAARHYNGVESVFSADVYLDYTANVVSSVDEQEIERALVVTEGSRVIVADSDVSMVGKSLGGEDNSLLYRNIDRLLDGEFEGQTTVRGDVLYYVNVSKIENTGWYFISCMSNNMMMERLRRAEVTMVAIGIAACVILFVLTFRVAQEMGRADQRAKTDPLTGLFNRDEFRKQCHAALAENPDQGVLLIFDLDNFKRVNDQLGHPEGDEVLKSFAGLLGGYFNRSRDIVARIGGDEFVVFLGRRILRGDAEPVLVKFIELFHRDFDEKYRAQGLSVSIGAAFADALDGDYNELYRRADEELYKAKQSGKNRFSI